MSTHKYASNIIERCLYFGSKEKKYDIINEVLSKEDYLHDSLISLVKDKFGNYVVQKMIENSEGDKKNEIIKRILNSYLVKRKEGYSKHVLNYIEQMGYNISKNNFSPQTNVNSNNNNNIYNNINEENEE